MNTLTHILPRSGSVTFGTAPKYGQPALVEKPAQRAGWDSDGNAYCYRGKEVPRCLHRLSWSGLRKATLDALLEFNLVAQGCRYNFVWQDHEGIGHAVNFTREQIRWKQTGPDQYNVSIGLEETIGLALIDENKQTLLDESGNEITW